MKKRNLLDQVKCSLVNIMYRISVCNPILKIDLQNKFFNFRKIVLTKNYRFFYIKLCYEQIRGTDIQ